MPDTTTYYAVVGRRYTREHPSGVLRRVHTDGGSYDEAFTRNLRWESSPLLRSAEHGDLGNDFYEISEDEANEIVEWVRRRVAELGIQPS
jgi:hypothetical protein